MAKKIQDQDLEISNLKARITNLEASNKSRAYVDEDAPNRGGVGQRDPGEDLQSKSNEKGSESTGEMANILSSMGAANVLASGGQKDVVSTASPHIPPASLSVATASATITPAVATAITKVPTSYTRRIRALRGIILESSQSSQTTSMPTYSTKGKEKMIESEKLSKKKKLEQLSEKAARRLEQEFAQEYQAVRDQLAIDEELARIQTEEYLRQMIEELDRSNEMVNKHMTEYEEAEKNLTLEEKIDLITVLLNYQKNMVQVKKYQAQ
ncbi:hypothetical protein Tco_1137416 [Tanacetum coccineum]